MKTALTVTGKGDKQWHHETVTVEDAVFRHGGTKGSDIAWSTRMPRTTSSA